MRFVFVHLTAQNITLDNVKMLVIDEADLILSFGHEEQLSQLIDALPKIRQTLLMVTSPLFASTPAPTLFSTTVLTDQSATLTTDVRSLQALVLRDPVVLEPAEARLPGADQLMQRFIKCVSLCIMLKFNDLKSFRNILSSPSNITFHHASTRMCVLVLTVRCPASDKLLVTYALLKFKSVSFIARLRLLSNVFRILLVIHDTAV